MKVLVFVKATSNSEKGIFPPDAARLFTEMGQFNEKLVKAGIMKEADGLKPSFAGKRLTFSDSGHVEVIDGPFVETKELVAGYWIWEVKSLEEAVEWAKQCPNPMPGEVGVLEIRPCYSMEEFEGIAPQSEFDREERLRKELARQQKPKAKAKAKPVAKAKAKLKKVLARMKSKPARTRSKK